jgi:ribosomal protein L34E
METNADEIERYMVVFCVTATIAKRQVRDNNRPLCHSCGNPIKGGTKGRHFFCKKTAHCVKAHNSYNFHRRIQNRSHEESIQRAVVASQILKLTNEALGGESHG